MATQAAAFHTMNVQQAKRSLAAYKGHLTRTMKGLDAFITECNNNPNQRLGKLISKYIEDMDDKVDTISAGYEHIMSTGSDAERDDAATSVPRP